MWCVIQPLVLARRPNKKKKTKIGKKILTRYIITKKVASLTGHSTTLLGSNLGHKTFFRDNSTTRSETLSQAGIQAAILCNIKEN